MRSGWVPTVPTAAPKFQNSAPAGPFGVENRSGNNACTNAATLAAQLDMRLTEMRDRWDGGTRPTDPAALPQEMADAGSKKPRLGKNGRGYVGALRSSLRPLGVISAAPQSRRMRPLRRSR